MQNEPWKNTQIYKAEHTLEVKERSQTKKSTVSFDIGISCNTKDKSIRRLFTRDNNLINSKIPEDHHIRLLYELGQTLYPLEIEVDVYEQYEKIPGHGLWFCGWQKKANKILKAGILYFTGNVQTDTQGNGNLSFLTELMSRAFLLY